MIYVYTGDGEGKTHIALGMALRAIGHGDRVVIVQFMKGKKSGEVLAAEKLPNLTIRQFGRPEFIHKGKALPEDYKHAQSGMDFAREILESENIEMLILDELNIAMDFGLVKVEDVKKLLESAPKQIVIVLTGRNAPKEIVQMADMVSEIKKIKHPYDRGIKGKKGVEW